MSAKINNFKIGLFTFIGVGLVVTGLLVFGVWSNLKKSSLFETYVTTDVSGLSVGSAVELRGVRVGKVTSIGFTWNEYQDVSPGYVVVVFEMNDDVSILPPGRERNERLQKAIEHGLRACPKALGVTGTCILSLEFLNPAENPPLQVAWTPRHTYIPSAPGLLGDLLVSMREVLHKLDRVDVAALNELAVSRPQIGWPHIGPRRADRFGKPGHQCHCAVDGSAGQQRKTPIIPRSHRGPPRQNETREVEPGCGRTCWTASGDGWKSPTRLGEP